MSGAPMRSDVTGGDAARVRADRAYVVLGRLLPIAVGAVRVVRIYTVAVALAAVVVVAAIGLVVRPSSLVDALAGLVVAGVVAAPVMVLWLFGSALREVVELPGRIGSVPELARRHGTDLVEVARAAQLRGGPTRVRPGDAWRAGRLMLAARRDLPGYGAALTLVSPTFLLLSLASALAGLWYLVLALPLVGGALALTST
ncbi:MAG: hypothetical protein MUE36_06470 [Acidimicrobiales bacterium]|jgi:hypothetical protein|nr:hypothetical protein [Acidimicrobiales bacterium]